MFAGLIVNHSNRACCGDRFKNVEVRAGSDDIKTDAKFSGTITINHLCNKFSGTAQAGRAETIYCSSPIMANYITVQILDDDSILEINEMDVIIPEGKCYYK